MLEDLLSVDWDEPPEAMAFERSLGELIGELGSALERCLARPNPEDALRLFLEAQALPCILLNYKICVEFGLPLHPTRYIDFQREARRPEAVEPRARAEAHELFLESLRVARAMHGLERSAPGRLAELDRRLPGLLSGFVFTNTRDKYTWRASNPRFVAALARDVRARQGGADLVVGAAHGSIRPGLHLAELLGAELYFVRFSLFKRDDPEPVLSPEDLAYLGRWRDRRVLLFDEDVAKGRTLRAFAESLGPRFQAARTAAVLRHYLAPFRPDFVGEAFYD
ncbi:MAG TPA: phosphoribosyltransferase [Myxococcota bacterium]|nr:phosphoribosyltransferase [Myxococcota bacterium]HRY96826.1 phosphoribosyltransferase [Myxococcota bacterium]HSA23959.1 phosphoribosyltransferase [Myxococcota bacterium]